MRGRHHNFIIFAHCLEFDCPSCSTWAEVKHSREEGSRHSNEQKPNLATQHGPFPQQHYLPSTQQASLHTSNYQKTTFCKSELNYLFEKKLICGEDNKVYLMVLNVCITSIVMVVFSWVLSIVCIKRSMMLTGWLSLSQVIKTSFISFTAQSQ